MLSRRACRPLRFLIFLCFCPGLCFRFCLGFCFCFRLGFSLCFRLGFCFCFRFGFCFCFRLGFCFCFRLGFCFCLCLGSCLCFRLGFCFCFRFGFCLCFRLGFGFRFRLGFCFCLCFRLCFCLRFGFCFCGGLLFLGFGLRQCDAGFTAHIAVDVVDLVLLRQMLKEKVEFLRFECAGGVFSGNAHRIEGGEKLLRLGIEILRQLVDFASRRRLYCHCPSSFLSLTSCVQRFVSSSGMGAASGSAAVSDNALTRAAVGPFPFTRPIAAAGET